MFLFDIESPLKIMLHSHLVLLSGLNTMAALITNIFLETVRVIFAL